MAGAQTPPSVSDLLKAAVSAVPGGITRDGQQAMATAVDEATRDHEHLLVQAGTGTGKSLAYLVPSLLVSGPVVISTATLALQLHGVLYPKVQQNPQLDFIYSTIEIPTREVLFRMEREGVLIDASVLAAQLAACVGVDAVRTPRFLCGRVP